jgi:pyridoxal 5-phosphate dependent beta-lyase
MRPRSPTSQNRPRRSPVSDSASGPLSDAASWRWWRERRLPAERLHLDTAAAGRSSVATLRAAAAYAEREATVGAYVAVAEAQPVLAQGRAELGRLLGVPAAGVAFMVSAEAALDALLAAWPLREGDAVAVAPCEWGPNLDAFAARGLRITELAVSEDGAVDLPALERMLAAAPPALVHLTQVTSHRALVQPVAEAAALCRAAGVPLWVDAAQALGHVDTACGADAIYATGRKWLTGPRGAGVVAVAEPWWDRLTIGASALMRGARPADSGPLWLLEATEANVAAWIGLCAAVQQHVQAGPSLIWSRLAEVGRQTREALAELPGWTVTGPTHAGSAITALRATNGQDIRAARARLLGEYGIVTTAGAVTRAPREMTAPLLRISPHVDCTPEDLARLRKALLALGELRAEGFDRRAAGGVLRQPSPQGSRRFHVASVVGQEPVAGTVVTGAGVTGAGVTGAWVIRADGLVVADHGLGAARLVDVPGEAGQRGDVLQPGGGTRNELAGEHAEQVNPLPGADEGGDRVPEPDGRGDPAQLRVLGRGVIAVGAEDQPGGGRGVPQLRKPRPEFREQPGLDLIRHRFPGAEGTVTGGPDAAVRPVSDQGAPEVDAFLDVFHVDVDLNLAARHLHPRDAPAPVSGAVAERGTGPVNLLRQPPEGLVAVGGRAEAQRPGVAQRADARLAQARKLRSFPVSDDGLDRRVIGPGADRAGDRPQVHRAGNQGSGAMVKRGERRAAADAVVAVDAPRPPAHVRQQAHVT